MPLLGLSWESAVLFICLLCLLPRVLGVGVNWLIYSLLRSLPTINVSIAGLSLRRITEIRLELLALPLTPHLTATCRISIDELAWTPSFSKLLHATVKGANVHLRLQDTHPAPPSSSPSSPSPPLPSAPPPAPASPSPPTQAQSASAPNIPELFANLSSHASTSTLPPLQRTYAWACLQLRGWVVHSLALSLSSVLCLVSKDDSLVSLRLASLLLYIERPKSPPDSHLHHLRQLHCKLGGIEVRLGRTSDADMLTYPTTEGVFTASFETKQTPMTASAFLAMLSASLSPSVPSLRQMTIPPTAKPPLLVIHPLAAMAEFPLSWYVPSGLNRIEVRGHGLNVHLDPVLLIPAVSAALHSYQLLITRLQAAAAAPPPPSARLPSPKGAAAMAASSATASLEAAKRRDSMLRFLPTFASATIHRISVSVFERETNSLDALMATLSGDVYGDLTARYGMGKKTEAMPPTAISPSMPCPTQFLAPPTPSTFAIAVSPILHHLELIVTINLFQTSFKTRYPLPTHFTPVRSTYDNHISSFDLAYTIGRGIVLYMSQQPERPLLSITSVKFDWSITPASTGVGGVGVGAALSFGQAASWELGLFQVDGEVEGKAGGGGGSQAGGKDGTEEGSLFHPLSVRDAQNSHTLSLIFVQSSITLHHRLSQWVQFGLFAVSTCDILIALIPIIRTQIQRDEDRRRAELTRQRLRAEELSRQEAEQLAARSTHIDASERKGIEDWRDNSRWDRPDALILKFSVPDHRRAAKTAVEVQAERGIQHHLVFSVKAISGVQVVLCSLEDRDPHAYVQLAVDEVAVRMEREPYTHSKHSMHDVLNSLSDDFFSLFSRAIIPYTKHRRIAPSSTSSSSSLSSSPPTSPPPKESSTGASPSAGSSGASSSRVPPSTAPREKVQINLTSLTAVLPHEAHSRGGLPAHPLETIKQPGRFLSLSSASVLIDRGSSDIVLRGDGLALKYTPVMLDLFPNIFHFLLAVMPVLPLQPAGEKPPAPPPPPSSPPIKSDYPLPLLNLKGSISNVTVDFPSVLEFRHDNTAVLKMAEVIPEDCAPLGGEGKEQQQQQGEGGEEGAPKAARPPTLFTYAGSLLSIDVHLPTSAWALHLHHSYVLHENIPFLSVKDANLAGRNPTATTWKALDVTADGVEGEWTPAMFLPLFKLIKDIVAAALTMKSRLMGTDGLDLLPLVGPRARSSLDWEGDPMLRRLAKKKKYVDRFRVWYHHTRARYLSEAYMHVTLDVRHIRLAGFLNRAETLSAFVAVDRFASRHIPNQWEFEGVVVDLLQHPLLHVDKVVLVREGLELTKVSTAYTEEQNLVAEYLDLALNMEGVRIELSPKMDIGPLLDTIQSKLTALFTALFDLPSLDFLSKRLGGPGYTGPPSPPAPGLSMQLKAVQFEVVDEPMESFLQHLHLLWLEERTEQERRRALLKLRIDKMRREKGAAPPPPPAPAEVVTASVSSFSSTLPAAEAIAAVEATLDSFSLTAEEASLYLLLNEYNSRSYIRRVEELKRKMREGESLKKASLMLCSVDSMTVLAGMDGELGSFYDDDVVADLIHKRRAEEAAAWEVGGRSRGTSELLKPTSPMFGADGRPSAFSPQLSSSLSPPPPHLFSPSSPFPRAPAPPPLPTLSNLLGRYFSVRLDVLQLRLRNFPLPLLSTSLITVAGNIALAQIPPISDSPLPHVFYDVSVGVEGATVAFSPCFFYTLNDVASSFAKVTPPMPSLHPPPPPPRHSHFHSHPHHDHHPPQLPSTPPPPPPTLHLLHVLRTIVHGRLHLSVINAGVHLLSSHSPYDTSHFLNLHVGGVGLTVDGALLGLKVEEVMVIEVPHKENQPPLVEMPCMDCWVTVNWTCSDAPSVPPSPYPPSASHHLDGTGGGGHRHVSIGNEGEGRMEMRAVEPDRGTKRVERSRPPALVDIHSNHRLVPPSIHYITRVSPTMEEEGGAKALSVMASHQHRCALHLSLAVTFSAANATSPPHPAISPSPTSSSSSLAPLAVTIHSGSLASLVQLASVYAHIPPLPMPNRAPLTRYYHAYHATRVRTYAELISKEMDVKDARLVLLDDNINDEMIGMMDRGEMDGNVFRRMLHTLVHAPAGTAGGLTQEALTHIMAPPAHVKGAVQGSAGGAGRLSVVLGGVYVERLLVQSLTVTVWEGADLGAARGLRLSVDTIEVVGEMQEERDVHTVPSDALKHSKIYLDVGALRGDQAKPPRNRRGLGEEDAVREQSKGFDYTRDKGQEDPTDLSPFDSHNSSPTTVDAPLPPPPNLGLIWSLSNVAVRMASAHGEIVYNARWMEQQQLLEAASAHDLTSSSSRVVLATYENERYTLGQGWSVRNLLPTDRPGWSNASGTEEVTKDSLRLPSDDWEWENDWQLDFSLRKTGEVDEDGWEYAHDFPRQYSRVRKWYCNVRRRRWIRVRKLKTADKDGGDATVRRKKKKVENAQNFVLSLALLSVHQKTWMHPPHDVDTQVLDEKRSLFRTKVIGKKMKSRRRMRDGEVVDVAGEVMREGLMKPKLPRRAQSISSVGNNRGSASTSLLTYFHIRNNTEDSIADVEERGAEDGGGSTLLSTLSHGLSLSIIHPPELQTMQSMTMYSDGQGHSPVSPSPSPSLSHVAFYPAPAHSHSSAPPSPLLALPTQHQVRIHDPRLLCTLDILSTITTLLEQYLITIQELMEPDREWLEQGRREERARQKRERSAGAEVDNPTWYSVRSQQSLISQNPLTSEQQEESTLLSLASFQSRVVSGGLSPTRTRRGSFTVDERDASTTTQSKLALPPRGRVRLASAEDASRRSTLGKEGSPISLPPIPTSVLSAARNATLPAASQTRGRHSREHSGSLASQTLVPPADADVPHESPPAGPTPPPPTMPIAESAVAVSTSLAFHCDCDVIESETKSEAQEFVCIEIINPQFNCHSEETRGRLLFMTSQITLYGRIDWIHSLHQPHGDSPYIIRTHSFSAPDSPDRRAPSSGPPLPIISRDKFRVDVVLDDIQAFVAPTDIDVDAGVIWMNKQNVGVLKSIMKPATLQVKAQLRPEMLPVTTVQVPERRVDVGGEGPGGKEGGRAAKKERKEYEERMMEAAALRRDSSTNLLPPTLTAGPHNLIFSHLSFNTVEVQLPEMTFNLDAYQFSLLVDVLKTIVTPLPMQAQKKEEEAAARAHEESSIEELKLQVVQVQQQMVDVIWQMKAIGWLIAGIDDSPAQQAEEQSEEHERSVQQHLTASSASNFGHFETWLAETAERIEKDQRLKEGGGRARDSGSSTELHQRFKALLREQNRLGHDFFSLLLAVRGKQRRLTAVKVHHLSLSVMVERINFLMMKNEKAFMNLYVDQLQLTVKVDIDATLDTVVEIKGIGGRNLAPHYQDATRPEYEWREMVSLFMGGGKGIDSAWTHRDVMLHVQCTIKEDVDLIVLKHLEVNLHPISVRITYEGITSIIDFFVTEQQRLKRQYQKYREQFLPQSQAVLDVDQEELDKEKSLLGFGAQSGSQPHSPRDGAGVEGGHHRKSVKNAFKGISNFFHRHGHEHKHSPSTSSALNPTAEEDELRDEDDHSPSASHSQRPSASMMSTTSTHLPPHHAHSMSTTSAMRPSVSVDVSEHSGSVSVPQTPNALSSAARKVSVSLTRPLIGAAAMDLPPTTSTKGGAGDLPKSSSLSRKLTADRPEPEPEIYFNYLRLGSSLIVLSYFSGGTRKYNIEDIEGLPVKVKSLLVQKKRWTPSHLASHLKKEVIKSMLGQVTETLGRFLGIRLGLVSGEKGIAMDKVEEESDSKQSGEGGDDEERDEEKSAGGGGSSRRHPPSFSSSDSPLVTFSGTLPSQQPKSSGGSGGGSLLNSPATRSKRLTAVGQKIGESGIRLLFGDSGKKPRKDSTSDSSAAPSPPPALPLIPITALPTPALPPRPPQHSLAVPTTTTSSTLSTSLSAGTLTSEGVHISSPMPLSTDPKGRLRSLSTGTRDEVKLGPSLPLSSSSSFHNAAKDSTTSS